jgi:RimJ/RimL family protein N-acetyltransferase
VDWGFAEGGLERIVSIYEPENIPSGRVMERLGFTHERTTSGPRGDTVHVMELTRRQWEAHARTNAHG